MGTNDKNVQKLISDYLNNNGWESDKCCGTIEKAFRDLQAYRQMPGNSTDLDYAAAEHYMFSRLLVCTGAVSETQMKTLVAGYDAKKMVDKWRGDSNKSAVTANPVSKPSWDVLVWGMKGASVGGSDCQRCNPNADPPFWRPVKEVLGGNDDSYSGRYGTRKQSSP